METSSCCRSAWRRPISTGRTTSATGVSPDSSGGDTASRLTTVRTAANGCGKECRRSARSGCTTWSRIRIRWIPGSPPHSGRSRHWGWPKTEIWITSFPDRCAGNRLRHHFLLVIRMIFSGYEQMGKSTVPRYCSTDWCAIPRDAR